MLSIKWHRRFLSLAKEVSTWSKDPSTKCGAIVADQHGTVISQGYNGFPKGLADLPTRYENRAYKYEHIIHAEMNAIINARQDLSECVIYNWPMLPCIRCAAAIVQTGIGTVVSCKLSPALEERWGESVKKSRLLFEEAGISVIELDI